MYFYIGLNIFQWKWLDIFLEENHKIFIHFFVSFWIIEALLCDGTVSKTVNDQNGAK